jgi:hypothetical protein
MAEIDCAVVQQVLAVRGDSGCFTYITTTRRITSADALK